MTTNLLRRPGPAALASALLLSGCAGIDVSSRLTASAAPLQPRTFALAMQRGALDPVLGPIEAEVREAVTAELEALGLEAGEEASDLVVRMRAEVDTRVVRNHPQFSLYVAELVESGTLTIELTDPLSGALLWEGSGTSDLRIVGVPVGPLATRFTPIEREREWNVRRKVAAILARLRDDEVLLPPGS